MSPGARRALALAALGLAIGVRLVALGARDFWSDEVHTFESVQLPWDALVGERLAHGHVPLYFLIVKAWTGLVGASQFALRLPSAVFGCLALWPLARLVRALVPSPGAALWAWSLIALHPLFVGLSREARMYPLLLLAALAVAAAVVVVRPVRRDVALVAAAAAIGPVLHPSWTAIALALLAWRLWIVRRSECPVTRDAIAATLFASVVLCVLMGLALTGNAGQSMDRRLWWEEAGVYVLRLFSGEAVRREIWLLNVAVGLVAGGAACVGWRRASPELRSFALLAGGGTFLVINGAALAGWTVWGPIRYVQFAVVPLTLLAATGASWPWLRVVLGSLLLATVAAQHTPIDRAWSAAAVALPAERPVVCADRPSRIVLAHYAAVPVLAEPPGAGGPWVEVLSDRGRPFTVERR